jgi:transcriptional regulator with XRE-family HTH domain
MSERQATTARPGAALKQLRRQNEWTLMDVSHRTGVPASTLSRIENDQISPTYDMLLKLSRGLDIDLAQLLSASPAAGPTSPAQTGRRSVSRRGDGETLKLGNDVLRYVATDFLHKRITPIMAEYRSDSLEAFGEFMRHPGEEFLLVLEGELELHTEFYAPVSLKVGESIYFDSTMGHAYVARSHPCRAVSICTDAGGEAANSPTDVRFEANTVKLDPEPNRNRARRADGR